MTSDNIQREREISLWDVSMEILLKWRAVVVAMLIGAVLFAGFSYMRSLQGVNAQQEKIADARKQLEALKQEEAEIDSEIAGEIQADGQPSSALILKQKLETQMTETQIYNVNMVLSYEELAQAEQDYQEKSLLMQMNGNAIQKAEITFQVNAGDTAKTYDLQKTYEDIICGGQALEAIAQRTNIPVGLISELVGLERTSYSTIVGTNTLRVYVRHYDKQVASDIMEAIIEYVDEVCREMQSTLGEHEITVLESSVQEIIDTGVLNYQETHVKNLYTFNQNIATYKDKFGKLEWQYYDICSNGELTELSEQKIEQIEEKEAESATADTTQEVVDIRALEEIIETGVTATPSISMKDVILGMALAAFVYVFAIFLGYILNNKMRSTDSLQELYGINQLGQIPGEQGKKKIFGFVDKWILSFRYRNKRRFSEAEALELASVAVKMAVGKASLDKVCLIGCDLKDASLKVCEQMQSSLQKENLQVQILNNVLYDAQAMEQLENAKCVVLVEKAGSTLYEEIARELELLKRQDITVLGGIVVE